MFNRDGDERIRGVCITLAAKHQGLWRGALSLREKEFVRSRHTTAVSPGWPPQVKSPPPPAIGANYSARRGA